MNYCSYNPNSFRQDSITHQSIVDSVLKHTPEKSLLDIKSDTPVSIQQHTIATDNDKAFQQAILLQQKQKPGTLREGKIAYNPFKITFNTTDNFLTSNSISGIKKPGHLLDNNDTSFVQSIMSSSRSSDGIKLQDRTGTATDWLLLVFIILVLLFIWIRIFYNRFFSLLANSLSSYQLSAKVFREKNVLLKRVSFVLDTIYLIVLSVFLYELFTYLNLSPLGMTSYNLFLFFLNILILFSLARIIVLKIFGYVFKTESVLSEYVHNNFIINKGIGIVFFPLVITLCYIPEVFMFFLLIAGLVIIGAGIIFKLIRGYQIIIRKEVLFFYLILYLCTLEILPLLLGYKVFMSLL